MLNPQYIQEQAHKAWDQATSSTPNKVEVISDPPDQRLSAIDDLRDGGTLSQSLEGYQERSAQLEMAQLVEQAIQKEIQALIEASTGTGKSLAYLIPVIRSGKKAIISTANKALQEQLYYKDVPFCQEHITPFEAALLKGKGNYLCLQRFDIERNVGMQAYVQDLTFKRVEKAVDDPTWNGDFETLPFTVPHEIRSHINVDENECARRKCPLYRDCYYYQLREKAQSAQVIITNHDTLLLSIQAGSRLLPAHEITIIDEAHTLESIATKQLAVQIRASQVYALLRLQRIKNYTTEKTCEQAREQTEKLFESFESLFPHGSKDRVALTSPVNAGIALSKTIEKLSNQLTLKKPQDLTAEENELYKRTITRCDNLAEHIRIVSQVESEHFVYYLERKRDQICMAMSPLNVAPLLRDTLFSHKTVVCTSATLSTPGPGGPSFDYFTEQTGMDNPEMITRILPLIFDYQRQALLYLPSDLPEPAYGKTDAAQRYEQAVALRMQQLVEASEGRAFLLFSSKHMLEAAAAFITSNLDSSYTLLQQGDMPTNELLKQFRSSPKAVLLGLKTFWEGVDIQGEALSLVVVDRLPFPPVDDPTVKAKLDYLDNNEHNSFGSYSIPSITISLKQAVGRLIRSNRDRGVMAILDTRLHTKFYGKGILSCLPPARRTSHLQDVEHFFQQDARNAKKLLEALRRESIDIRYVDYQPDPVVTPSDPAFPVERYVKIVELESQLRPALQRLLGYQLPEQPQ
jgi:Rad3-related DNA helicase